MSAGPRGGSVFRSLRLRLLASFGLVILVTLLLAGIASMWLLRTREAEAAEQRIGRLVEPLALRVYEMEFVGWPRDRIYDELGAYAQFFDVRVMLLDDTRRVIYDSGGDSMVGDVLNLPPSDELEVSGEPGATYVAARIRQDEYDLFVFTPATSPPVAVSQLVPTSELQLVVAVPAEDVTEAWARLLPRLLVAAGAAALVAVVLGSWLANRITRPIQQMTRASEAMARGDYEQEIEVRGPREVGNLAHAFNQMAAQVNRSSRAMRQLLGDVSHELKTPLTSIQGFSQALVDGVVDHDAEESKRLAGVILEESERMQGLVEDLLYLSRIESGELPLVLDRVELDPLLEATVRRLRYQADAREVGVDLALDGDAVRGDERRLEQVFANLLENAIRFAPSGSRVGVATSRQNGSVVAEVRNGGEPIPADEQPHIFDRFYQVDRARTRGGHSGLGLAIVQELVQAHGGTVAVRSSAEAGTVFTVRLPTVTGVAPGSDDERTR